ncbi:FAD-dependent monooxygenase [Alicyclobacillus fodiniaquatilis]|uniref:FAD-dependent monooxygenase n=1 Tax=Alicyclobacillus fodiniaquatilis TaxID=1661150 RepID=A0ABW4JDW2_9BACL
MRRWVGHAVRSTISGPGLKLGLQDTVNLGWKLAAVIHDDARGRVTRHLRDGAAPAGATRDDAHTVSNGSDRPGA